MSVLISKDHLKLRTGWFYGNHSVFPQILLELLILPL